MLKTRLGKHTKNRTAIQNGRLQFLPGFAHYSTTKGIESCVQDLWQMIEGNNMLELNFTKVYDAVQRLRRAIKRRVETTETSKF